MTKTLEDYEAKKGGMVIDRGDFESLDSLGAYIELPDRFEPTIKGSQIIGSTITYTVDLGFGDANELFSSLKFKLSDVDGSAITAVNIANLDEGLIKIGITGAGNTQYLVKGWNIVTEEFKFGEIETIKFIDTLTLQVIHHDGSDLEDQSDILASWIWIRVPS